MKREHGKGLADIASIKEANFCTKKMQTQKKYRFIALFLRRPNTGIFISKTLLQSS